jgi:hypothetical protein
VTASAADRRFPPAKLLPILAARRRPRSAGRGTLAQIVRGFGALMTSYAHTYISIRHHPDLQVGEDVGNGPTSHPGKEPRLFSPVVKGLAGEAE